MFWSLLIGVSLLTTAVLFASMRSRSAGDSTSEHDGERRLEELEEDLVTGQVGSPAAELLRYEIEHAPTIKFPTPAPGEVSERRGLLQLLILAGLLLAFPLYLYLGRADIGLYYSQNRTADLNAPEQAVNFLIEKVRERAASAPEDTEAWEMLARSELKLQHFTAAREAAEHLYALRPEDPASVLLLVDALTMENQGQIGPRAQALIVQLLQLAPDHPTALVLLGIVRAQHGERNEALGLWRKARNQLPPGAPVAQELDSMIASTEAALGQETTPLARLEVSVTIEESLRPSVQEKATLFVALRNHDPASPRAPLAVARIQPALFPAVVTLDESMSVLPGIRWQDIENTHLVARVTASGNPLPQPGDLEGRSTPFNPTEKVRHTILIDKRLPQP